jgi:hypothetical protein
MCTIIIVFINLSNLHNIRSTLSWAVLGCAGLGWAGLGCRPLKAICKTSTIYKSWFSVHVIISRSQLLDLNLFI